MDQSLGGLVPSQSELFSLIHEVLVSVASSLTGEQGYKVCVMEICKLIATTHGFKQKEMG